MNTVKTSRQSIQFETKTHSFEKRSRELSYLLRHDNNYCFEPGGWRLINDLKENHSFNDEEIFQLVLYDSKGRFEQNQDKSKIRALYGHSVQVDLLFTDDIPPEFLYHGTASKYISSIESAGLCSKSRQFVHLTEMIDVAINNGLRHGEPIVLKISSAAMASDGYKFHRLNNGIWLSKEIPTQYIQKLTL